MAVTTVEQTDNLDAGRVKINANFAQTLNTADSFASTDSPTPKTFQVPQVVVGPTTIGRPLEILNAGYTGHEPASTRHNVPGGLIKVNWSVALVHNWVYDYPNLRATTGNTSFPTSAVEAGGEGVSFHTAPTGSTWYSEPTMNLLISGNGARGVPGYTSGWVNQFNSKIYVHYATDSYQTGKLRSWQPSVATDAMFHLHAEETKGTDHEFSAYEINSSNASPAAHYFTKSRGSYLTKTVVSAGDAIGRIGFKAYDGDEYHINAYIDAIAAVNGANNVVPLDIRFVTSATNQASGTEKLRITGDGAVRSYAPIRGSLSTISGVPAYTAATSLVPTPIATDFLNISAVSTTSGGSNIVGLTNNTAGGFPLIISGIHGSASPTGPTVRIAARKTNGSTNFTDIAATEIAFQVVNNATVLTETLGNGNTGFGVTTPTALVHVAASTTARAGLRVVPGAAPTTGIQNGDIWIDSTAHTMHVRINGVTKSIDLT